MSSTRRRAGKKQKDAVVRGPDPTEHPAQSEHTKIQFKYSSPIPMASEAERYEALSPGATERMLNYADEQQIHRQGLENRVVDSNIQLARRGQWMGFTIGVMGIITATYLISTGHPAAGIAMFFADIGSLVGVFVYGRREAKKEKIATLERLGEPGS